MPQTARLAQPDPDVTVTWRDILGLGDSDTDWMRDGLCAQADPDAWFPEKGGSTVEAKRICARCPVAEPCLEYALANHEPFGVWGGTSEKQRRVLQRNRRETGGFRDVA